LHHLCVFIISKQITTTTMPLESCMILLDCSQYMRNGDYVPTRFEAQTDAANLLVGAKTNSHPESTVGVSAGTELLLSPTENVGKILSAVHSLRLRADDASDVPAAVAVASLALKHRRNKNGAQRIVLFVGTPVTAETKALQKAGKLLKKNNVAIDVILLGQTEENESKLRELVDAANSQSEGERTCHLVTIPAGVLPSDVLASSPIVGGGAFAAAGLQAAAAAQAPGGGAGGDAFAEYGGVDPNMDPELAMALRVSMEEERARQERAAAAAAAAEQQQPAAASAEEIGLSEEEALLQQALAMSMNENEPAEEQDEKPAAMDVEEEEQDEDAAMQMALQMSMQTEETKEPEFQDPSFVRSQLLLEDAEAAAALKEEEDKKKKDADKKQDDDKKE
jgi:26S proteasome regulatory subunit N10